MLSNCPPESVLLLAGTDAIGELTYAGLESHVEECLECQEVIEAAGTHCGNLEMIERAEVARSLPGFTIGKRLGKGSAGAVYLARQIELKRDVALKVFPKNPLIDPHFKEHWLSEAQALSRTSHPNVVSIYGLIETEKFLCLNLEYVPGGTLKDRLTEPLPPRDAARLGERIARAVAFLHSRGVAHLDLKPSNILLAGEPGALWDSVFPKISDFGIARLEGEPGATMTGANGPKGTPSYMAPEQVLAESGTIGRAADLHAIGAILYHLLTGRPPYQSASTAETLRQVRDQVPVSPRRLNDGIALDLETICLKCLEKLPGRRYASAEALADDLNCWLEGRSIKARRASWPGKTWRWCRRHPAVAGLLFLLGLTVATALMGLAVLLRQAERDRALAAGSRRRAESYEQFARQAVDEINDLLTESAIHSGTLSQGQTLESLLKLRDSTLALRTRRVLWTPSLGRLEARIATGLMVLGKEKEADELMHFAVLDLERNFEQSPRDGELREDLAAALTHAGWSARSQGRHQEALAKLQRAAEVRLGEPVDLSDFVNPKQAVLLYFDLNGLEPTCSEGKETNQRIRRTLLERLAQLPLPELPARSIGRRDQERWKPLHKVLLAHQQIVIRIPEVEKNLPLQFNDLFHNWLEEAVDTALALPLAESTQNVGFGETIPSEISAPSANATINQSVKSTFFHAWVDAEQLTAGEHRKLGRRPQAEMVAGRLMAVAKVMVREYPDRAEAHFLSSIAHDQFKKNAVRREDAKLEKEALVQAIEAGRRALALAPRDADIRHHVDKLEAELARNNASSDSNSTPNGPRSADRVPSAKNP